VPFHMSKPNLQFQSLMATIRETSLDDRDELLDGYFPYETIKFSGRLKFLDETRSVAIFTRRQRVRFLEDDVSVLFDRIWGNGLLLGRYSAPTVRLMEPIKTAKGYVLPLGLPKRFRKGEVFDLVTHRRIVSAFTDDYGYWETLMSKPTELIQISVVTAVPAAFDKAEIVAPPRGDFDLAQGANSLKMRVTRPALNGPYRLAWAWKEESRAASPTL
jgi:hypothetical protein